jgi:hypothetical protein
MKGGKTFGCFRQASWLRHVDEAMLTMFRRKVSGLVVPH